MSLRITSLLLALTLSSGVLSAQVPAKMSYQGVLTDGAGASVADGNHSLVFKLYSVSTAGSALWTETQATVNTTNGVLSVVLGSVTPINIAFDGALWLGIAVDGGGELTPRIELTTSPYAFQAESVTAGQVVTSVNALTDAVTLTAGSNVTITPSGNDLTIASSAAGGNNLDMAYDEGGAGVGRTITADTGPLDITGTGGLQVTDGGVLFTGTTGTIPATGAGTRLMWYPAKGALRAGKVTGTDWDDVNIGTSSTITGGEDNAASGAHATVSGGINNAASGQHGTVAGGEGSLAGGISSTVPGGKDNEASGNYSFAAGQRAKANHAGAFVWADQTAADFASTAADQFLIRAAGGVGIGTAAPGYPLHVVGAMYATGNLTLESGAGMTLTPAGSIAMNGNPLVLSRTSSGSLTITSDITLSPEAAASAVTVKMTTGDVGIGTTAPAAKLHVNDGSLLLDGTTGAIPATGAGTRLMWYPAKAAFRAGVVAGTQWDDGNIGANSTVGGGQNNQAAGLDATIAGGTTNTASGAQSVVGGGTTNVASGTQAGVLGGSGNTASGQYNSVGGGLTNIASLSASTIAGGANNTAAGNQGAIGGGATNNVTDDYGTIGGGQSNQAGDNAGAVTDRQYATVGGGFTNTASGSESTVSGGRMNVASGPQSTVGGGDSNTSSSTYTTVAGGLTNTAVLTGATVGGGSLNSTTPRTTGQPWQAATITTPARNIPPSAAASTTLQAAFIPLCREGTPTAPPANSVLLQAGGQRQTTTAPLCGGIKRMRISPPRQ